MGRSRRFGWAVGVAVFVGVGLPQVGLAEQLLEQLPKDVVSFSLAWVALPQGVAEVTKDHGPLAGASWGVIKGTSEAVSRVVNLMDKDPSSQTVSARGDEDRSPAWLNLRDHGSRQAHHEPALLRYTF